MRPFILRWLSLVPVRKREPAPRPETRTDAPVRPRPGDFRAVELKTHGTACRAARAWLGKRILVADAPTLPLADCTLPRCVCYYKHHADRRRDEPRRAADVGVSGTFYVGPERRSGLDRRRAEPAPDEDSYYDYMRRRD